MAETSKSLLQRLRADPDDQAWERLVSLYRPFIYEWLRRRHLLQDQDANDVVQETLVVVLRRLPTFEHNGQRGAFHKWLRDITYHSLLRFWRSRRRNAAAAIDREMLDSLHDPDSDLSRLWDLEHQRYLAQRALDMIEPEFEEATLRAFRRVVLDEAKPVAVAAELGLSRAAVDIATSRVRRRLRQVLGELEGPD